MGATRGVFFSFTRAWFATALRKEILASRKKEFQKLHHTGKSSSTFKTTASTLLLNTDITRGDWNKAMALVSPYPFFGKLTGKIGNINFQNSSNREKETKQLLFGNTALVLHYTFGQRAYRWQLKSRIVTEVVPSNRHQSRALSDQIPWILQQLISLLVKYLLLIAICKSTKYYNSSEYIRLQRRFLVRNIHIESNMFKVSPSCST